MKSNIKSLQRAYELKEKTNDYLKFKNEIRKKERIEHALYLARKSIILKYFNATEDDWNNWKWQIKNRVTTARLLTNFITLSETEIRDIQKVTKLNRFAIVPYYLALMTNEKDNPIKKIAVPSHNELNTQEGYLDPMDEKNTNPAGCITRRYPDRLIINVTNVCAMYCRHCQRRRLIDEYDHHSKLDLIRESIEYVRNNKEIRDVLLTGGDALLLSNDMLESILADLRSINHVEIIRIGTRTPVTMPMRITDDLVAMLKKYHPIYLNTQFNHYSEITHESKIACSKLANAGVVLGNQAVLLKGINDNPYSMTYLNQKLLQTRVRPYYIFHAKNVKGTTHFIPKLSDGLKIMDFMRGNTSGLAIPTYIMNAPLGLGKVPLLPEYIIENNDHKYTIRTWENKTFEYIDK